MKKIWMTAKRTLTVLLTSALIVTSLPQTGAIVCAAGQEEGISETGGTDGSRTENSETADGIETDGNGTEDGSQTEDNGTENDLQTEESGTENLETIEEASDTVPSDDENAETQETLEETLTAEETTEEMDSMQLLTVDGDQTGEEPEQTDVTVKIHLPYVTDAYHPDKELALSGFLYGIGEDELKEYDMTSVSAENDYIEVTVPQNGTLKLQLKLNEERYILGTVVNNGNPLTADENGIYAINGIAQDTDITISAERLYTFTFDTVHAKIQKVVTDEGGNETFEEVTSIRLPLSALEDTSNAVKFKVEVDEGCLLRATSSDSSAITFLKYKYTNGYYIIMHNPRKLPMVKDETKIFVTAEEAEKYDVAFDLPADIAISVYTQNSTDPDLVKQELSAENKISVAEGSRVRFSVVTQDISKGFYVTYTEDGITNAIEPSVSEADGGGRDYTYDLEALSNGDVSVKISVVNVHNIRFDTGEEDNINLRVCAPVYEYKEGSESIKALTAIVPDGYELKFQVIKPDVSSNEDYQATASADGKEIPLQHEIDSEGYYEESFKITPTKDMTIQIGISAVEFKFDYADGDIEDIKVLDADVWTEEKEFELSDNKSIYLSDYNTKNLTIKIKPAKGKRVKVTYERFPDPAYEAELYQDDVNEEGYIVFSAIKTDDPYDHKVTIQAYDTCDVTFKADIDTGNIDIKRMYKDFDGWYEWEWDTGAVNMEEGTCTISPDKGSPVYFAVQYKEGYRLEYVSTTEDAAGNLKVYDYDEDNGRSIYRIIPTGDMTITVKMVKLKDCEVTVVSEDENVKWSIGGDEVEGKDPYTVKEGSELIVYLDEVKEGYRGKVTYQTGEGTRQDAEARYYRKLVTDDEGNEQTVFDIESYMRITGDTTIYIDTEPVKEYTVTFDNAEALDTVKVWQDGSSDVYPVTDGKVTLSNDKIYYFDISPKEGKYFESVTTSYGTPESAVTLTKQYDYNENPGWLVGKGYGTSQDVTIHAELSDAYTLDFDTTQLAEKESVCSWEEYDKDGWYLDITNSKIAVPVTGSYTFFTDMNDYDVKADSDAFDIIRSYGRTADSDIYILYTIVPKQDVTLPAKVTVSFVKKTVETHTITLDYPEDGVRSISVGSYESGMYSSFKTDDPKQISVSGSPLVLRLWTLSGFISTVTITGTDGTPKELPVCKDEAGTKEYYIGDITADSTITVAITRGTDKRKYYEVGFQSSGAAVKDSVYQLPYETDAYDVGDGDYYLPYNVERGKSISFFVEPYYGYEIEGVYVGNTLLTPTKDNNLQKDVYTVTPTQNTLITVKARRSGGTENEYDVTFNYSNEVKSVTVQGYELGTDRRLSLPAGTTISFSVELAGENYEIRSVTANGKEVTYDKDSGLYTMTTGAEDTDIVIVTGSKPQTDPDKKYTVTFSYPKTVKAVIFKDNAYTLENNQISAADGAKVYFKVDLAEGYEVDSTTIGMGLKLELEEGWYVLTVSADAGIEIATRRVQPEVTGISITGVKDGKLELLPNLIKEYQIKLTPEDANSSGLKAEVTPAEGTQAVAMTASVEDCMLKIDTTNVTGNESAVIKIYNDRTGAYVEGGTVTVTVTVPSADDTYETKLKLQKGTTTIYTGQSEVKAATVKYSTDTTVKRIASVKDTTELTGDGQALTVWESDDTIYIAATEKTQLGKHTLEVTAYAPRTLESAKAVITVNVVRGIEELEVTVPTTKLYKPDNKKVTLKAKVAYNSSTTMPKVKRVTYEALDANGRAISGITVKNGTITVDRSVSAADADKNNFRVHVKAADYDGNSVEAYSEWITLNKDPLEIDNVYIMKENDNGTYDVVVKAGDSSITTDRLENAFVIAMSKGSAPLEEGRSYSESDLINAGRIDASLLTYKFSNKALNVHTDGGIEMIKYANRIKLTLTTTDGGKKKKDLQFNLKYAEPQELQLGIRDADYNPLNGAYSAVKETTANFEGTANSILTLNVQEKEPASDTMWRDVQACVNHTVSIKGGKILSSNTVKGEYQIVVTGREATITLADKTVKNRPRKQYTVTNTAYTTVKAPKVSLAYYNNNDNLAAKSMAPDVLQNRKVTFTLKNAASSYSYARLEEDKSVTEKLAYNSAGYLAYEKLMNAINEDTVAVSGGKFTIQFDESAIPAGSYKLKIALSNANGNNFKAETGLISVTLKVAKPKAVKGSFKPKASYTLKVTDGYKADVTYTAKQLLKDADGRENYNLTLRNANIKGKENDFLKYFELDTTGAKPVLKLKEGTTAEQIAELKTKAQKDNLTGYIVYEAKCGDNGYGRPYTITGAVKIKVTLK